MSPRRLTATAYLGLGLIGLYVAALGPGLPGIAARTHMPLAQAGAVFGAIFAGSLMTSLGAGRAIDHFGRRPLLMIGSLVHGLGCLLLAFAGSWPQALASGVVMGVGDGTLVVGYHVLVADLHPDGAGAALNKLNVAFGVGALSGPAIGGLSILAAGDIRYALGLVAAMQCLVAYLLAGARFPLMSHHAANRPALGLRQLVRLPLVWALATLLLLYVAAEVALGNWTYTYLRGGGFDVSLASLLTSGYWLMLTLGRALSPTVLRRLAEPRLLVASALLMTAAALLLVAIAPWRPGGAVLILIVGLGCGPIWPLAFAVATGAYAEGAGAVSGILTTAGSIGGLVGPWLQGVLLLQHGVHAGLGFTLATSAGVLLFAVCAQQAAPARDRGVPAARSS